MKTMITTALAVSMLVGVAVAMAEAQTFDCHLLTMEQARGLTCGAGAFAPKDAPKVATPAPAIDDAACVDVNPYADPDTAARCALRPQPADAVPTFQVGKVYAYGYDELRAVVLGVTTDIDGIQVVTVRWLREDSRVDAFRTPPTPGGGTNWTLVTGAR